MQNSCSCLAILVFKIIYLKIFFWGGGQNEALVHFQICDLIKQTNLKMYVISREFLECLATCTSDEK